MPHCRVKAGSTNPSHAPVSNPAPQGVNAPPCASVMNCGVSGANRRKSVSVSVISPRPAPQWNPSG